MERTHGLCASPLRAAEPRSTVSAVLDAVLSSGDVIQDFCPLADSIEWQLGQRYWAERGSKAFLSDASPVPYLVNNDGNLSGHAAQALFAALKGAEGRGALPDQVFVLEIGIGVGLFARFFLDAFQQLCWDGGKDYYDRLCYIAGDRSERMLLDACRSGVFANHPGRYRLRVIDALEPARSLGRDLLLSPDMPKPFWAVFLNYVLDCLPPAIVDMENSELRLLNVRTSLARGTKLGEFTDLTVGQLAQRARSANPEDVQDLFGLYDLFRVDYAYLSAGADALPWRDFAARFGRSTPGRFLFNYGAIQALEKLLDLLHHEGFILINDYGQTEVGTADFNEHQRFSNATSIGLNFSLLKAYFSESSRLRWVEPAGDNEHIHSRLLGHEPALEAVACFQRLFGKDIFEWTQQPAQQARELVKIGRLEAAIDCYREALSRQPRNWRLMNEVANFLVHSLAQIKEGVDVAKVAVGLNPTACESWNTLGDGLFEWGRFEEAKAAYSHGARLNSHDVHSHYGLAWVHAVRKAYSAALVEIAHALTLDRFRVFQERLLQKQTDILAHMHNASQQEQLRRSNRISSNAHKARTLGNEVKLDAGWGCPRS